MNKKTIITLVNKHPKSLISFLTLFILISAIGVTKLEKEYSQKSWFRTGDPLVTNFENFSKKYGSDSSLITLLSFKESVFQNNNLKRAFAITEDLWKVPNFVRVDSLTNYSYTTTVDDEIIITPFISDPTEVTWNQQYLKERKELASTIKPIQNYLISDDQKSVAIYSTFKHVDGHETKTFIDTVAIVEKEIIEKYQADDLKIMLTGSAVIGKNFEEESTKDFLIIIPLAFLVLFIILSVITRNFIATTLILGLIAVTLLSTLGIQGWLGIKVGLVTAMCPLIVLAICVADTIHIFSTYFQAQEEKLQNPLNVTMEKNLYPTFLTTVTTIIGFLALCGAELYPIADMGIVSMIGIFLAWVYTIFILCPLLKLIPIKANLFVRYKSKIISFSALHTFIARYPKHIVAFFLVLTSMTFYYSAQNTVDSNMLNYFGEGSDFRKATNFFEENIGGTESIELIIDSGKVDGIKDPEFLTKVETFVSKIYSIPDVTKVNSILSPLKEVNQVLNGGDINNYAIASSQEKVAQELFFLELSLPPTKNLNNLLSQDKKEMRISVYWKRSDSSEIMLGSKLIMKMMKESGLKGHVTGMVPLISGLDNYILSSFFESMIIAIVLISILMMFVFKSVFFGLFSMIPNIIVPSFGAAILYASGKHFDAGSILIFSICLGIAIDDTIFFLTNFRTSMEKKSNISDALKEVLENTGHTLTYTTFILVVIFGLFYLGSFIPNQNFAIATSVILTTALVLDLVFLPALLLTADQLFFKFRKRV